MKNRNTCISKQSPPPSHLFFFAQCISAIILLREQEREKKWGRDEREDQSIYLGARVVSHVAGMDWLLEYGVRCLVTVTVYLITNVQSSCTVPHQLLSVFILFVVFFDLLLPLFAPADGKILGCHLFRTVSCAVFSTVKVTSRSVGYAHLNIVRKRPSSSDGLLTCLCIHWYKWGPFCCFDGKRWFLMLEYWMIDLESGGKILPISLLSTISIYLARFYSRISLVRFLHSSESLGCFVSAAACIVYVICG
jgi:hypothetical protein